MSNENIDKNIAENTKKMLEAVRSAERSVESAERWHDRECEFLNERASIGSFNIYSDYDIERAAGIVRDAEKIDQDMWSACTSAVIDLDETCKPLYEKGVKADAIKEVADTMSEINAKVYQIQPTINANFLDVLSVTQKGYYAPSVDCVAIEKMWYDRYEKTPEAIEAKKRRQAAMEARRKREAERAKKAAEERKRKAEEEKLRKAEIAAQEKKMQEENASAKAHMDKCAKECHAKVKAFKKTLDKVIEERRRDYEKQINDRVNETKKEIAGLYDKLATLGTFKFSQKKEIKKEIKKLDARIIKYQDPSIINAEINAMQEKAADAVGKYEKEVDDYLSKRFSDYKSTKGKNAKKDRLYVENSSYVNIPCPDYDNVEKVFGQ